MQFERRKNRTEVIIEKDGLILAGVLVQLINSILQMGK